MTNVDPFLHPIPQSLKEDSETRQFFEYFVKWAHDIWLRTGGSEDSVSDTGVRESYPWAQDDSGKDNLNVQGLYSQLQAVKILTKKVINSESYTAVDDMLIKSKNGSTLKLPLNPSEDCVIYAHNADGTLLTINGNGRKINGHDEVKLARKGNGLQIYYFVDENEYIAI